MGRFFGPTPNVIASDGFFLGSTVVSGPTFMVVGANTTNPNTSNVPHASWRDPTGAWHVISTASLGARGLLGVTHVSGKWYATTNAPGLLNSLIGVTGDGSPPSPFSATPTGLPDHLSDITFQGQFVIGSLFGNIITAPLNLSAFSSVPSHGPGSYTVQGVRVNSFQTSYVCVGNGSNANGICQSNDSVTWANVLGVNFSPELDQQVVSNTIVWDGAQFVAVGGAVVATSPNGNIWALSALNTTTANCISWDAVNGLYYVGDQAGNVLSAPFISTLAIVPPVASGSAGSLRCVASSGGITVFGDDQGLAFSTPDGSNFATENPGLGGAVLNGISGNT